MKPEGSKMGWYREASMGGLPCVFLSPLSVRRRSVPKAGVSVGPTPSPYKSMSVSHVGSSQNGGPIPQEYVLYPPSLPLK